MSLMELYLRLKTVFYLFKEMLAFLFLCYVQCQAMCINVVISVSPVIMGLFYHKRSLVEGKIKKKDCSWIIARSKIFRGGLSPPGSRNQSLSQPG